MRRDALNRRLRYAEPQPLGKFAGVKAADVEIFDAIQRHGPLPTHLLYEFAEHLRPGFRAHADRLTKFYHGAENTPPMLSRPPQQFASFAARYQPLIYDLTEGGKQVLAEAGRRDRYTPRHTDHFLHRLMGASVSASIELLARQRGIEFIPAERILTHPRCPESARTSPNPLAIAIPGGRGSVIPDNLFGLRYAGDGYRFFAIEIDRSTESIERKTWKQNAFAKKVHAYCDILRSRAFETHWGIPNLLVLTVTTNRSHMFNILRYLTKVDDPLSERFLFKAEPMFGVNWRVPREVLTHLFAPWERADAPFDISKP